MSVMAEQKLESGKELKDHTAYPYTVSVSTTLESGKELKEVSLGADYSRVDYIAGIRKGIESHDNVHIHILFDCFLESGKELKAVRLPSQLTVLLRLLESGKELKVTYPTCTTTFTTPYTGIRKGIESTVAAPRIPFTPALESGKELKVYSENRVIHAARHPAGIRKGIESVLRDRP